MHTLNDISCIKTDLIDEFKHKMRCEGFHSMDTCESGQIIDMIKDLSEAEKNCMEKCYYEEAIHAMNDFEGEFEVEGRMGYDNRRYSNGQYAPKGHGHYSPVHGYTPNRSTTMPHDDRMGYPTSQSGTTRHANTSRMGYIPENMMDIPPYSNTFNDYRESKRHYTETKDPHEKKKMDHYAKTHTDEIVESIKEIWYDASPETKKEIKGTFNKLLAEMQM